MSAIAGILQLDNEPTDRSLLQVLTKPATGNIVEAVGYWQYGTMGLGHALTRVTAEVPSEKQPLVDAPSGCVIVFDGRLDNRSDLKRSLPAQARLLDQQTDAAYTLAAYLAWGEQALDHLLGDFAFAIWNARTRQLLLARDPCGIRPLYYSLWRKRLTFASTLEQLLNDRTLSRDLNEEVVLRFLYADSSRPTNETYYRQILHVPGGHFLLVDNGQIRLTRYWHWQEHPPESRGACTADVEEFRAIFAESVRCRLRSTQPVGIVLSGGLDSGAIACMAGYLHEQEGVPQIRAYSAIFDQFASCDERKYSRAASSRYGFPHTCIPCDDCWSLARFEEWLPVFNEPLVGAYDAVFYETLAQANKDGVRAMLMGDGGDHLLTGSSHYLADWFIQGRWRQVHAQLRAQAHTLGQSYAYRFAVSVLLSLLPVRVQEAVEYRRGPQVGAWIPAPKRRQYRPERYAALHGGRNAWWYNLRDQVIHFGQGLYNGYKDRLMRLFGLEIRQPFFDVRLVQFILRTPPDATFWNGKTKVLLRESLRDILPPVIRDRTDKANFSPLMHYGLRERRRSFVEALLEDSELERRGYVVPDTWKKTMQAYLEQGGEPFGGYWRSLTLEMWLRFQVGRLPPWD